jgi:hypothetical protein
VCVAGAGDALRAHVVDPLDAPADVGWRPGSGWRKLPPAAAYETIMYESIRFEGFRALNDVRLEGPRRVNLIVGKNNVGKTTALEGLLLLGGATNPAMLLTLGQMRGQRWDRTRPEPEPIWRSFSHAFQDGRLIKIAGRWGGRPMRECSKSSARSQEC